ncbi:MAG: DUF445 family protein [Firmicutes bacterium]|jgi:uncharacterized membrane protein YheB (UPF0754 family)|nr:DUF445 family protein [Bacillota bacterium]NLO65137.1 DUF445 family protein [Bacillota bacterium]
MDWELITLPLIAALIGWGTNVVAIKMLFWPRKPINILGWQLLGVLPKRQQEIAVSIGEVLDEDLLPTQDLIAAVNTPATRRRVAGLVADNIAAKIDGILPRFVADYAGEKIRNHLGSLVENEIEDLFTQLGETLGQELQEQKLLGSLVRSKIATFDLQELERLVLKVAKNELRYIEVFGAVLGFIIGILQVVFIQFFR